MSNHTTRLFGLGGVEVVGVELDADDLPMLALVTCDEQARCCPGCGVRSERPHSWVRTYPRDLPVASRRTGLTWTKRRWRCLNERCTRRTFTESLPAIPPRSRLTCRLRTAIGESVANGGRTVIQAARDHEVSWPVANAAFTTAAKDALPAVTPQVEHLGIDETRRGKAKFRLVTGPDGTDVWEVVADRWHIGFVDLTGGAGLLGQVEGRTAASVSEWIDAQSRAWRTGVHVVAIDMCTLFKAAVTASLPHAILVVDLFHVVQLANDAVPEVRRRVTLKHRGRRGRKGNREWELRNRLTRAASRMHADHLDPMVADLKDLPKSIGEPILMAWNVKEDLRDLLDLHGTNPTRHQISNLLTSFYKSAAISGLPEIERLATTISTWWPQILAAITTGVTNSASEGINRAIKTDARCAYGYGDPATQRLRARCATTRRARGHLATPHQRTPRPTPTAISNLTSQPARATGNTLPRMQTFTPGTSVQRREVLHGRVWMEQPVTVVSDDGDVLAVQLDPGSPFTFHDHPHGPHPWSSHSSWSASVVLQLLKTNTAYGVWKLFSTDGTFLNWYINFEAPIVRQPNAFDTDDHGLDLIVHPDGTRAWKDVEDLHRQRAEGRIDLTTVGRVLAAASEVTDLLDSETQWWTPWTDWKPDIPS